MGEKANVIVMGNSGSGKSTLINSVFNLELAAVGDGDAVTEKMEIYETEDVNFRVIDKKV
jgi:GTP-binding protein EngB required for normal cell division